MTLLLNKYPRLFGLPQADAEKIVELALSKLHDKGFIRIEQSHISYFFSQQHFQARLVEAIQRSRPSNREKAMNVLKPQVKTWLDGEPKPQFLNKIIDGMIKQKIIFEQNNKLLYQAQISQNPTVSPKVDTTQQEQITAIINYLKKCQKNRPKTQKALHGSIHSWLKQKANEDKVNSLIKTLQQLGYIRIEENKVIYHLK